VLTGPAQWDSYLSLIFPADPASWKRDLAPIGAMKAWLEADRQSPLPAYLDAAKQRITDAAHAGGLALAAALVQRSVSAVRCVVLFAMLTAPIYSHYLGLAGQR
jgi:hypothetical protein